MHFRDRVFSIEYDGAIGNRSISFRPTVNKKLVTFQQLSFSYGYTVPFQIVYL